MNSLLGLGLRDLRRTLNTQLRASRTLNRISKDNFASLIPISTTHDTRETDRRNLKRQDPKADSTNPFKSLELSEAVVSQINENFNWVQPTEIQKLAIPLALRNKNIILTSSTGQGKTATYLLPIINKIYQNSKNSESLATPDSTTTKKSPGAVILVPTSQLAHQVVEIANILGNDLGINAASITGETELIAQAKALDKEQLDILVCTIGRFVTYLDAKSTDSIFANSDLTPLSLKNIHTFVVDEADYVLGNQQFSLFSYAFDKLVTKSKRTVQSIFLSSTISENLKHMILAMYRSKAIPIFDVSSRLQVPENVKQIVYVVSQQRKYALFKYFRHRQGNVSLKGKKVIIFVRTIQKAERTSYNLDRDNIDNLCLHSELSKTEKQNIVDKFNRSNDYVLVCTEFGSRGIDFSDVHSVINFDIPHHPIDYIHRAGRACRTGGSNKTGNVISFVSNDIQSVTFNDTRVAYRDEMMYMDRIKDFLTKNYSGKLEFRKIPGPFKDVTQHTILNQIKKLQIEAHIVQKNNSQSYNRSKFGSWTKMETAKKHNSIVHSNIKLGNGSHQQSIKTNKSRTPVKPVDKPSHLRYERVIGEYQSNAKKKLV